MKFISEITVKAIEGMQMGSDAMIAAAAWVSTSKDDVLKRVAESPEDVSGVINYLMKHRHGSPFEHGAITMYIHAPIFVFREWHRHRIGWSYNEESARYKKLEPVFYVPWDDRPMMKVDDWKPGRPKFQTVGEYFNYEEEREATYNELVHNLTTSYRLGYASYEHNLKLGLDPGLARDCLPVGIYSSMWATANPRSLMNFLSLRQHHPDAAFVSYPLYEINKAADAIEEIFQFYWPTTYAAFVKHGRVAP